MKSKSKIGKQIQKKKNPELVQTIILAKKNPEWLKVAQKLSSPRKLRININLEKISKESKAGEIIIVPGKVLSGGEIDKKIKIAALNFSEKAKEKLLKQGCEVLSILEEIKKNPSSKGVKILTK